MRQRTLHMAAATQYTSLERHFRHSFSRMPAERHSLYKNGDDIGWLQDPGG